MAETAVPDTIIENPILNSPFRELDRHWRFTDEEITNEIVDTRRASAYFEGIKGDVRNCCGKMASPRRAGLPGSFNLSKQLRMCHLSNQRVAVFSERRESRYQM
jgi:hypothetical protein